MKKRKIVIATTAAAVAGLALYLAFKQREKKMNRKRKSDSEEYLANTFSHAKRFEGGEFVL
jgi:hypothetical protein